MQSGDYYDDPPEATARPEAEQVALPPAGTEGFNSTIRAWFWWDPLSNDKDDTRFGPGHTSTIAPRYGMVGDNIRVTNMLGRWKRGLPPVPTANPIPHMSARIGCVKCGSYLGSISGEVRLENFLQRCPECRAKDEIYPQRKEARPNKLQELNTAVTAAIFRAEHGNQETRDAFADVSRLEGEIASLTSPTTMEGGVSRRGAVRAAIDAGAFVYAVNLVRRFVREPGCPTELQLQLCDLLVDAVDRLAESLRSMGSLSSH